jgi:spermidine synthase
VLYLAFFCSGLSGLIYQVVWVRVFGNVFGNTIYAASTVVAVFMLGLGAGGYVVGAWADRRYAERPESLLRTYAQLELVIGALGLGISALLPRLEQLSALVSSYVRDAQGWYVLSTTAQLARAGIAVALLGPITLLMGGTLTLLIRHLVRSDLQGGSSRIAVLYAVNTGGAALGCFLTDFLLVPASGLLGAQLAAVFLNVVAAAGAFFLAQKRSGRSERKGSVRLQPVVVTPQPPALSPSAIPLTGLALAMSGFAAMGMEILWFRHFSILLGGFRAVFSLLLTVILAGIGAGSLASSVLLRHTSRRRSSELRRGSPKPSAEAARAAQWWLLAQGLFVVCALVGLATADASAIGQAVMANRVQQVADSSLQVLSELWFNAKPILLEAGLPALLMGFGFPLANAIIQRSERSVGRHAGLLYLANTCGAVCGSLAAGFLLLPVLGIQATAALLTAVAGLAMVPLYFATRPAPAGQTAPALASDATAVATVSTVMAGLAIALWSLLPPAYIVDRAAPLLGNERLLTRSEGLTEVIAVADVAGSGRTLLTDGHPMSSTSWLSQRYMRALVHVPLLSSDKPSTVLVIGFGVGNTTHAATLHPSIRRVEVADLSRGILGHAAYFADANQHVLNDPRVVVYVNDGRHHLQMQRPGTYDLITLEPPPIAYAGVAALYSREFYALARTRLTPGGYISQWLPAYQVPAPTTLAMIRAFIEVFPHAVLISGAEADLLLVGVNGPRLEIEPERLTRSLANAPAVQADLRRLALGTVREIAGTFVGSAQTLAEATREMAPVTDNRPLQEYSVRSLLNFGEAVPGDVVDLGQLAAWCPKCFVDRKPVPLVEGLDTYQALLGRAYAASAADVSRARSLAEQRDRVIFGSAYLGAIVPETAEVHNLLGIDLASRGRIDEGITEFRRAMQLEPGSAQTHWHLGAALAYSGAHDEALEQLRVAVQLDPNNREARHDLEVVLAASRR